MKVTKKQRKGGYGSFRSDISAEQEGVILDYGSFRVTIARAGGSNKAYERILESLTKPYRRAIQLETLDGKISEKIMKEAMAKTIVLNWEVLVDADGLPDADGKDWKPGLEDPDTGDLLAFSWENVLQVLQHNEIQNLYHDLRVQSGKEALFLQTRREEEGNDYSSS
ncbi:MAG: hypothetical protein COZ56_21345 [Armatimonadetes bacterium CG_4_8_14_3_um_filter_58_9]|nr:MAG: hypothetical protein COZ56_21345 [Armatimonadetes bacterium CG_4_8_14_3_um_filter_58_9]